MSIVRDPEHSDRTLTVGGTGIRVNDIAVAYEHSRYDPDEITQLYPDLSLGDVHRALAYDYDHIDEFRGWPLDWEQFLQPRRQPEHEHERGDDLDACPVVGQQVDYTGRRNY